jgi:hypothetical protein
MPDWLQNLHWSKEPVAYITFLILIGTTLVDYLHRTVDVGTALNAIIVGVGGIVTRSIVYPPGNVEDSGL